MMIEPIDRALAGLEGAHKVLFSPAGARLDQTTLDRWPGDHLALVCGRYEGVDQRVTDNLVDEEISLGDFVIAGGEPAAMAVIEGVARLLGVVGNPASTRPSLSAPGCWRSRSTPGPPSTVVGRSPGPAQRRPREDRAMAGAAAEGTHRGAPAGPWNLMQQHTRAVRPACSSPRRGGLERLVASGLAAAPLCASRRASSMNDLEHVQAAQLRDVPTSDRATPSRCT